MWTYTDNPNLLPNLIIRSKFKDNVLVFYEIYPANGYVLRIPNSDVYHEDENGNLILVTPYRTWGGATEFANYDWATNPENYYAELYDESMEVFNKPDKEETI